MIVMQANVLISDDGKALLTDFGFSVAVNSSFSMAMSRAGGTKGTLRWMSPEILDGDEISPEADVWAFGMTALVCVSLFRIRNSKVHPYRSFSRVKTPSIASLLHVQLYQELLGMGQIVQAQTIHAHV